MKIKMLTRYTAPGERKLEQGLIYEFPESYARGLVDHGLAVLVIEIGVPDTATMIPPPGFVNVQRVPPQPRTQIFVQDRKKKAQKNDKS